LIPPNPNSGSRGYAFKIGTTPHTALGETLLVLLKEKELEMKEGENSIIIYKAKQENYFSCV